MGRLIIPLRGEAKSSVEGGLSRQNGSMNRSVVSFLRKDVLQKGYILDAVMAQEEYTHTHTHTHTHIGTRSTKTLAHGDPRRPTFLIGTKSYLALIFFIRPSKRDGLRLM